MMVFAYTKLWFDLQRFVTQDWSKYDPDAMEAMTKIMPKPQEKPVLMTNFSMLIMQDVS